MKYKIYIFTQEAIAFACLAMVAFPFMIILSPVMLYDWIFEEEKKMMN